MAKKKLLDNLTEDQQNKLSTILSTIDRVIVKATESDSKAVADLVAFCDEMMEYIAKIRYQDWPTMGLGIDLKPHEMDDLLNRGETILRRGKKLIPKKRKK
jgi:hypothetical protein